jgi:hypothetical protein
MKAVIHGGKFGDFEVLATQEKVSYYPPGRMGPGAQDAFVSFGLEWHEGSSTRNNFLVKVDKGEGDQHFSLVVEGDDPGTARIGIRPYKGSQPDETANILWAQQNIEPRDYLH